MATIQEQIVSLGIQFMGISNPFGFVESEMAKYIVTMLPEGANPSTTEISNASEILHNTYDYINADTLTIEIKTRIIENMTTTKISNVLLIGGLVLVGLLLFKKK